MDGPGARVSQVTTEEPGHGLADVLPERQEPAPGQPCGPVGRLTDAQPMDPALAAYGPPVRLEGAAVPGGHRRHGHAGPDGSPPEHVQDPSVVGGSDPARLSHESASEDRLLILAMGDGEVAEHGSQRRKDQQSYLDGIDARRWSS